MKYVVDVHTHTIASGHAYTTLLENVKEAAKYGLKVLGTSDHGPLMPGGPHDFYFGTFRVLPRELDGVILLHGCEANIMDYSGKLDISKRIQERVDYIIASLHDVCISPGTIEENTNAYLNAMENPYVDILGHIGNPRFEINFEEVVKKAKEKNIIIEINNGSFESRLGSEERCLEVAKLCKKYKVKVILGTDSHICFQIGRFPKADALIKQVDMPEELIMNTSEKRILEYLRNKGKIKDLNNLD